MLALAARTRAFGATTSRTQHNARSCAPCRRPAARGLRLTAAAAGGSGEQGGEAAAADFVRRFQDLAGESLTAPAAAPAAGSGCCGGSGGASAAAEAPAAAAPSTGGGGCGCSGGGGGGAGNLMQELSSASGLGMLGGSLSREDLEMAFATSPGSQSAGSGADDDGEAPAERFLDLAELTRQLRAGEGSDEELDCMVI